MNELPLVSVIITTYNRAGYIKKAVESILTQTYKNIEIIIVDDCSSDGTSKIISGLSKEESRIIAITNETNFGNTKSANTGIEKSKGKYIARLDDDDVWCRADKLEKQVDFLEKNPEYALVGGGIIKINKDGKEIVRYLFSKNDEDIRKIILADNAFAHSTVLYRRNIFERAGGYDEQFAYLEDRDLWLKLGRLSKFYNFQEFFAYYLDHEYDNPDYVTRNNRTRRRINLNIKLIKKYRNDYPGYKKAFLFCWTSYFYSFLPFRQKLRPILFKLRTLVLGPPAYKYFK